MPRLVGSASRAEPLFWAREMGEPSRARLVAWACRSEPSTARLVSNPTSARSILARDLAHSLAFANALAHVGACVVLSPMPVVTPYQSIRPTTPVPAPLSILRNLSKCRNNLDMRWKIDCS
jgi:hypothetical protein